jgi:hypothetical protein
MPSTLTSYSFPFAIRYLIFRRYIPLEQNDYRRKWDKEEYLAKSKAQDAAAQEYAQAAQAAQAAGKRPPPRPRAGDANLGPKPTKALEAREEDLGIEKNLGKSMLVAAGGKGPGAGFYVSDSISSGESQLASWERVKEQECGRGCKRPILGPPLSQNTFTSPLSPCSLPSARTQAPAEIASTDL